LLTDIQRQIPPYDGHAVTSFCQAPISTHPISVSNCRYSPIAPTKNGFSRHAADNGCHGGGVPSYNTITSSTFKVHQHPLTYNGLGTLPITTTVKDVGRDRYATIAAGGGGAGGGGGSASGDGTVLAYQTTGYSKRFPAHSAALGFQSRGVDGGYFTDDRQLSDGDSNSPVGSP
jgi:hypothetical protein